MDEDLSAMQRLQAGEDAALELLMARHKDAIFRLTFRFTGNASDAADITEDTFVKVYFKAHQYKPSAKVKTWIFTIAANLSRDFLRRAKKRRSTFSMHTTKTNEDAHGIEETLTGNERAPSEQAEMSDQLRAVEVAIQGLPYKLRFPFTFCILEAHSYSECAEILKVSSKTIETRIYRARQKLKSALPTELQSR